MKNFTATDAWCPPKNDENQYLQVDLSRKTEVTKLATQGQSGDRDRHVKTYALLYSNDGNKWEQYTEKGKEKVELSFLAFLVIYILPTFLGSYVGKLRHSERIFLQHDPFFFKQLFSRER